MKTQSFRRLSSNSAACLLFTVLAAGFLTFPSIAADPKESDATGTWRWSIRTPNGQTIQATMRLKQEGEKLTGVQTGPGGQEIPIRDGRIKDGNIFFTIVRERGGDTVTTKHEGKLHGDTIEGKTESNFGGEARSRDWRATREKEKPQEVIDATGTWKWTFTTPGGQSFEPSAKLKQSGDRISGTVIWGENEMPVSDGQVKGNEMSFKVVRQRDGRTITTKYQGKISGRALAGKIESDWGGEVRSFDWEAKQANGSE